MDVTVATGTNGDVRVETWRWASGRQERVQGLDLNADVWERVMEAVRMIAKGAALVLFLLLLYATPVGAVTITSGSVGAWQGGDFGGDWDLHGAGYDLVTFHHGSNEPVGFLVYTATGQYNQPRDFSHTVLQAPWLGDAPPPPGYIKGHITWTIDPVTVSPTAPFTLTSASAPFSMTGVLNGIDVDGIGTFKLGVQGHDGGWHVWSVNFTFEAPTENGLAPVPEPATLFLVGSGLVAAGVWHRRRRR